MASAEQALRSLVERLTFDQMLSYSDPRRVLRSRTVRGPALDVSAGRDTMSYFFNFKAYPSTTGQRHKGYIRFFKPRNPNTLLTQTECLVDCDCPDFRYRWAWSLKQRGSSVVGAQSANKAWNRAPRITNPRNIPGLCKHVLALRDFLYGQDANFVPSDEPEDTARLDRLIQRTGSNFTVPGSQARDATPRSQTLPVLPGEDQPPPTRPESPPDQTPPMLGLGPRPTTQQNPEGPTPNRPLESVFNPMRNQSDSTLRLAEELQKAMMPPEPPTAPTSAAPQAMGAGESDSDVLKQIRDLMQALVDASRPVDTANPEDPEQLGAEVNQLEKPAQDPSLDGENAPGASQPGSDGNPDGQPSAPSDQNQLMPPKVRQ